MAANPSAGEIAVDEALLNRILGSRGLGDEDVIAEIEAQADVREGYFLTVASFSDPDQASQ
ncbi:MAG: hypothetical protein MZV63_37720 [Marinilabiliales bacterium]|nr:hypothetical protein [Marinilabiliales bacterium]